MSEETLFHQALEKPAHERDAFLKEACGGNETLRLRIETLLRAHEDPRSLLDRPVLHRAEPTIDTESRPAEGFVRGSKLRYFGDYELIEEIARGGMGVVYKARQKTLKRTVALKMILAGEFASTDDVKRFYAEAEAAARLEHPGIVPIFEIGQQEGQHYFSMAFIEGESLARKVAGTPLPPADAARLMKKIADAVAYAHVEGVIHRDLKPANVLLDKSGEPHVTDFGLAKRISRDTLGEAQSNSLTATGQVLGTPGYMPPEQAQGKIEQVGQLSDVYSLGAMLYCLLTGRPPFQAASPLDTLMQVVEREPIAPRALNPDVPQDLETICLKCLAKEPKRRYESATAFASDLQRFLNDEPILARRPGVAEQAARLLRKQRRSVIVGMSAAAAAVAILIAAFAGFGFYTASRTGYLTLKTNSSVPLTAEVFNERNELETPAFTVPTTEPIALKEGSYRVRLSGSGVLSEDYLFEMVRGKELPFTLSMNDRTLGSAIELSGPNDFEVVDFGDDADFVILFRDAAHPAIRRVNGSTGKTLWELNVKADSRELAGLLQNPQGQREWNHWVSRWNTDTSGKVAPRLLNTAIDLDSDGVNDLIWATTTTSVNFGKSPLLVAVSGKNGQPLWWVRSKNATEAILGMPVAAAGDGGVPIVIAMLHSEKATELVAFAGNDGRSLWHANVGSSGVELTDHSEPHICNVNGQTVAAVIVGPSLMKIDCKTGERTGSPFNFGFVPQQAPVFMENAGETLALVKHENTPAAAPQSGQMLLTAVSLASEKVLWETTVEQLFHRGTGTKRKENWPFGADFDSDGKGEVVAVEEGGTGGWNSWIRYEMLEGTSGQPRWQRRFPLTYGTTVNQQISPPRFLKGPDIDGDGVCELIVVSARADLWQRENAGLKPSRFSLFVDAFSGKDGHTLWWNRVPLGSVFPHAALGGIDFAALGASGADGLPQLTVTTVNASDWSDDLTRTLYVFSTATGKLENTGENFWNCHTADFDGDGSPDLCAFAPYSPRLRQYTHPAEVANWPGKLTVFRGGPPDVFRRFGAWNSALDFSRDGSSELYEVYDSMRQFYPGMIVSGRNGSVTANWNVDWNSPHTKHNYNSKDEQIVVNRFHFLQPPFNDFDNDGTPDTVVTSSISVNRNAKADSLILPLQAVSGKAGQPLWTANGFQVSCSGENLLLYAGAPTACSVDNTAATDLVVPYDMFESNNGWREELGLALVSAQNGKVKWSRKLAERTVNGGGHRVDWYSIHFAPEFLDVDGDGVRDVICCAGFLGAQSDSLECQLMCVSGRTGELVWKSPLTRPFNPGVVPAECPIPIATVLDGGPAVLMLDWAAPGGGSGSSSTLRALNARDGSEKWKFEWSDRGNWNDRPHFGVVRVGTEKFVCVGRHESGNNAEFVILDRTGAVRSRRAGVLRFICHDIDGDGNDELIYESGGKVLATSIDGEVKWEWAMPGGAGGIRELNAAANTLVVETAGSAQFDSWGMAHLLSHPPTDGMGRRGDSIFGLNAKTGQPLWRGRRDTEGTSAVLFSNGVNSSAPEKLPLILSRPNLQWTTVRASLPTAQNGKITQRAGGSRNAITLPPAPNDPRLLRRLPWMPTHATTSGELFRPPLLFAAYSLLVLVIPGSILFAIFRRRTWSLRGLLMVPAAFVLSISFYNLFASHIISGDLLKHLESWQRLAALLFGLPILAFPAFLIAWTTARRWKHVLWLLGAALGASLILAGAILWIDSKIMDPAQSYSPSGWWMVLLIGPYVVAAILLIAKTLGAPGRAIKKQLMRLLSKN